MGVLELDVLGVNGYRVLLIPGRVWAWQEKDGFIHNGNGKKLYKFLHL